MTIQLGWQRCSIVNSALILIVNGERRMMKWNVFTRTSNGEREVSSRLYNLTVGAVLCWGFWTNWLMVGNIPVESIVAIDPLVFLIGYCTSCFFGVYLFSKSSNPLGSFVGYNFVVVPFAFLCKNNSFAKVCENSFSTIRNGSAYFPNCISHFA